MKNILERLFGIQTKQTSQIEPCSIKTIHPPQKPSFNKWCKEYNVSVMWNRDVSVHIE